MADCILGLFLTALFLFMCTDAERKNAAKAAASAAREQQNCIQLCKKLEFYKNLVKFICDKYK